ncbi:hypothetical protein ACFFRL_06955 [Agromyces hippuratus]
MPVVGPAVSGKRRPAASRPEEESYACQAQATPGADSPGSKGE